MQKPTLESPQTWFDNLPNPGGGNGPIQIDPRTRPPVDPNEVITEGQVPEAPLPDEYTAPQPNTPVIPPRGIPNELNRNPFLFNPSIIKAQYKQPEPTPVASPEPSIWEKISGANLGTDVLFPKDKQKSDEFINKLSDTLPARMVKSAYNSLMLPRDVIVGDVDPNSLEGIKRSFEFAGNLFGGGVSTAGIRTTGVGIFGGKLSANPAALKQAEELFKKGASEDTIWQKTGMFKGIDGEWLHEIPDVASKLKIPTLPDRATYPEKSFPLSSVLEHSELYKRFPELKDVQVQFVDVVRKDAPNTLGLFNVSEGPQGRIVLSKKLIADPDFARSAILHEIQHYVQAKEGFKYRGTNQQAAYDDLYDSLFQKWYDRHELLKKEGVPASQRIQDPVLSTLNDSLNQLQKNAQDLSFQVYQREPGEIQARLVQERRNLSEDLAKFIPPDKHLQHLQKKDIEWVPFTIPEKP